MNGIFRLDRPARALYNAKGQHWDPVARNWRDFLDSSDIDGGKRPSSIPVDALAAVTWLQRESGHPVRVPIGVIGPREATQDQLAAAESVGAGLAAMGLAIVCGGREGVMEAVCRGAARHAGIAIGMLPDSDPQLANSHVTISLATGLGEARNAVIARAALALIAIGDSYGTLSEVALGLHFGKRVIGINGAARINGVEHVASADAALNAIALHVLCARSV